jgi:anthranilate/para-aminobenzoate synthase component I
MVPGAFTGGWVGYTGYDTVRYTYPSKIPFNSAPEDDRDLLDMHLALYRDVVIFDNATKLIYLISWVDIKSELDSQALYAKGLEKVWQSRPSSPACSCRMTFTTYKRATRFPSYIIYLECVVPFKL